MDILSVLYNYGVSTLFAPALTVFTLFYGLLRRTKIFGGNEKLYFIISIAFTFYFIHSLSTVEFTIKFLATFSLGLISLFLFLVAISIIYPDKKPPVIVSWLGLSLLVALYKASQDSPDAVTGATIGLWEIFKVYFIDTGAFVVIVLLGSLYLFYRFLTGEPTKPKKNSLKKIKGKAKIILLDEDEFKKYLKENNNTNK